MSDRPIDLTCSICRGRGEKTYALRVHCLNCGTEGIGVYSKGHDALCDNCPVCGANSLRPSSPREIVSLKLGDSLPLKTRRVVSS